MTELEATGVKVAAPACDISDSDSIGSALALCSATMPRIKGCIQCAMVLKVSGSGLTRVDKAFADTCQGRII